MTAETTTSLSDSWNHDIVIVSSVNTGSFLEASLFGYRVVSVLIKGLLFQTLATCCRKCFLKYSSDNQSWSEARFFEVIMKENQTSEMFLSASRVCCSQPFKVIQMNTRRASR